MPTKSSMTYALVCSLALGSLAGCASDRTSQESHAVSSVSSSLAGSLQEEKTIPQTITMNSSLEELPITNQLALEPGQMIQNCHVMDKTLYFLATVPNDLEGAAGFIYRTKTLYAYDLANRTLRTLKEIDLDAQEAVVDFFEKDGVLYEAYQTTDDNGWYLHIRINDKEAWSAQVSTVNSTTLFWQPDGSICFLASPMENDPQMERDLRWATLNRIRPDLSSEILWDSRDDNNAQIGVASHANDLSTPLVFTSYAQDENGLFDLSTSKLNYFDGQSLQSIPCAQVSVLIPLSQYALISLTDSSEELHALNYGDMSLTAVENASGFQPLNGAGSDGDRFIWADQQQTQAAQLKNGVVTSAAIAGLPESHNLSAFQVEEGIDLLAQYIVSNENPESQTISWKYYLYQLPEDIQ
ncbi:hypothetical protein IM774_07135 [Erysipelotrichaceae bacterium RD49]|nr:hypothetical protein [Erysipelotrichaceae bacterium RD49]